MSDTPGRSERVAQARTIFCTVNPHCLQRIAHLAREVAVFACCNITDEQGTTLCASGAKVSTAITAALAARRLRQPLEACLDVAPGVSPADIVADSLALMGQIPALALLGCGGAVGLARAVGKLSLSGPLKLLLTVARTLDKDSYQQSLAAMIVCSGLAHGLALGEADGDALILAALVHDIGDAYLDPPLIDGHLPACEWLQVAAHPGIGHAFLTAFTDLPPAVADCVLQHHERQDGSGYPSGVAQINPLATLIGVADCVSAVILGGAGEFAPDALRGSSLGERVAVALSMVPGEFPGNATAFVNKALAPLADVGAGIAGGSFAQRILPTLQRLRSARLLAEALSRSASTPGLLVIGSFALAAILRLDKRLRATGVYDISQLGVLESDPVLMGKTCLVLDEVGWRLRHLARSVYLRTAQSAEDAEPVAELVAALSGPACAPRP